MLRFQKEKLPTIKVSLINLLEKAFHMQVYMTKTDQIKIGGEVIKILYDCLEIFDTAYGEPEGDEKVRYVKRLYNRFGTLISLFDIIQRRHLIKEAKNHVDRSDKKQNSPTSETLELEIFRFIADVDTKITKWNNKYPENGKNVSARLVDDSPNNL